MHQLIINAEPFDVPPFLSILRYGHICLLWVLPFQLRIPKASRMCSFAMRWSLPLQSSKIWPFSTNGTSGHILDVFQWQWQCPCGHFRPKDAKESETLPFLTCKYCHRTQALSAMVFQEHPRTFQKFVAHEHLRIYKSRQESVRKK